MSEPLISIPNIGPATEKQLIAAGITDGAELRQLGAHEAYRRMLLSGAPPSFLWYFVLMMSLQGRPWNDAVGDEKKALRKAFDALVKEVRASGQMRAVKGLSGIEAELDAIGVRYPEGAAP